MYGFVDAWLRHIKDVYHIHQNELNAISDEDKRADRLTELNVIDQVRNLAQTKIVQNAWHQQQDLQLHAWVYGLNNGLITELKHILDHKSDIDEIYRYDF